MDRRRSYLPPEVIETIMSKLSVKSLFRFKSVSKSWDVIISHPFFIRNYSSHNVYLRTTTRSCLSLVKLEGGKLKTVNELKFPSTVPRYECRYLCVCEYGVILISNDWLSGTCHLWNPSSGKTTRLLLPFFMCCSGICYDPAIDDFKVVTVSYDSYAVYSCKNESWSNTKKHPYGIAFPQPLENSSGVSINGAIYWLLRTNKHDCAEIIYYDPRDDMLKILLKPKDVPVGLFHSHLIYLGGRLCLYRGYGNAVRIWTKEKGIDKNSWKQMAAIDNVHESIWLLQPVCFVGNKIVFQYTDGEDDKLFVYGPLDKVFEQVGEKIIGFGIESLIPFRDALFLT